MSGLTRDVDIKIEYTGLRPGEKLYEEMLMDEEGLKETENSLIHIGKPLVFDGEAFLERLNSLYDEAYDETENMKELVAELVPTYKIREEDKERDRKKIEKKYQRIYGADVEKFQV